ncbi:MFS transporter [Bifidobacterium coryneforme]|uniref:Major facilitator superfamily MFS_1 n=1 Tax=Bifidobacterium [indicum] DSM 20214 = LMG 11587 TaxID=1341694 RepID=A0A087VW76_9BIFI|nr:MFS transporter [Bifidobacterium indicum]AIC92568.1 major facilitator superfamily MFS_1 [Bifidobacterium indicum LMG 11587 = DSM 20214]
MKILRIREKWDKAELSYYASLALLTISKSQPHAILTVLLLRKGLNLADIMFVQAIFNVAVFVFELPSGVISDLYDRKIIYECSIVAWILTCLIIFFGNGFLAMSVAWAFYGIAEALSSGTVEASTINIFKANLTNPEERIKRFKRISSQLSLVAMIVGASLGAVLYFSVGFNMYLFGIAFACLSALPIALFFPKDEHSSRSDGSSILKQVKTGLGELKGNRTLTLLIMLTAVGQIFFQTHFNLWQAYMLSVGIREKYLIAFYFVFQVIGILSYSIRIDYHLKRVILFATPFAVALPLLILLPSTVAGIFAYCAATFAFMFLQYLYDVLFSLRVSQERISTLITLNSTISRISGFLVLGVNGLLLKIIDLKQLIVGNFEISLLLSILIVVLFLKKSDKALL